MKWTARFDSVISSPTNFNAHTHTSIDLTADNIFIIYWEKQTHSYQDNISKDILKAYNFHHMETDKWLRIIRKYVDFWFT